MFLTEIHLLLVTNKGRSPFPSAKQMPGSTANSVVIVCIHCSQHMTSWLGQIQLHFYKSGTNSDVTCRRHHMSPFWSKHVAVSYRRTKMKCTVMVCDIFAKGNVLSDCGTRWTPGCWPSLEISLIVCLHLSSIHSLCTVIRGRPSCNLGVL